MEKKIRVLVMDNQILTPVEAGGPLRIVNIFANLPKKYEVHYLGVTGWQHYDGKKKKPYPHLYEQIIPLSKPFLLLNNLMTNALDSIPAFDVLCSKLGWITPRFRKAAKKEIREADILVTSHPWFFSQFQHARGKIKVYDSHNCEYMLYRKYCRNNLVNRLFAKTIMGIEREAYLRSDAVFACTKEDAKHFAEVYGENKETHVVPNPVDLEMFTPTKAKEKLSARRLLELPESNIVVFMGSRYLPNIEAFDFIMKELVPNMRDYTFLFIGTISQYFYENIDALVKALPEEKISLDQKGMLGYGWFDLERWGKEGFGVRWTKKSFSILIKDDKISDVRLDCRSTKPVRASVAINGKSHCTIFYSRDFRNKEFKVDAKRFARIEVHIHSKVKSLLTDVRDAGIAVRGIEYRTSPGGKWKIISLDETVAPMAVPENVKFYGKVPMPKVKQIYSASEIAINPIFSGSGLNIKMLDYFASGLTVISTKHGARGLDVVNSRDLIICDEKDFEKEIRKLTPEKMHLLGKNARKLAEEKYSKEKIGKDVGDLLDSLMQTP